MKINKNLFRILFIHLTLMLLVFSGIVFVFFEWALPAITKHGQSITVPNLKGIPVEALDAILSHCHMRFKLTDDVAYSSDYPPLVVLEQYPKAGSRVKEGRRIYLTLNASKPPEILMPNLVDGSLRNAQVILKSKGLKFGQIKYVPDMAKNAVLEQKYQGLSIAPGTRIVQGSCIDLVVGAGLSNPLITVPNLSGMKLEEVELLLLDLGVQLGKVVYQNGINPNNGIVSAQVPIAGSQLKWGDIVDLWLEQPSEVRLSPEPNDQPILRDIG